MKINLLLIGYFFLLMFFSCNDSHKDSNRSNNHIADISNKEVDLVCDNNKFDFGNINMKEHDYISTEFELENIGDKPILINKTDVSCGCISVNFSESPILIKEKRKIKVVLDVKKLNGYFDKKIFVKSNAKNDVMLLHVSGTVVK